MPVIGGGVVSALVARDDLSNDHLGLTLGEHSCLWGSCAGHVADRVDIVIPGLQGVGVDGDPTVFAQSRLLDYGWHVVPGNTEEEICVEFGAVLQTSDSSSRVELSDQVAREPIECRVR